MAETKIAHSLNRKKEYCAWDGLITNGFIADGISEERSALHQLLIDEGMEMVGQSANWPTHLIESFRICPDMLLMEFDLLSSCVQCGFRTTPKSPPGLQAAIFAGSDVFLSKGEIPERVAERRRIVAASIGIG